MTDRISIPALRGRWIGIDNEGMAILTTIGELSALVEAVEAAYRFPCTNCKAKFAPHHPACPGVRFDFGESDA